MRPNVGRKHNARIEKGYKSAMSPNTNAIKQKNIGINMQTCS
jgi:hypothetical protein